MMNSDNNVPAVPTAPQELRRLLDWPVLIAGVCTIVIGLMALMGWGLDVPWLATFGAARIPMAPSTAIVFLCFGAALCLRAQTPLSRWAGWISAAIAGLVAMVALLLLGLSWLNVLSPIEHLGLKTRAMPSGVLTGHMSPVTAVCFLLASLSFLSSLAPFGTWLGRAGLGLVAAGLVSVAALIFSLAYLFGPSLLYGGTFIPPALSTILAMALLSLALLVLAGRRIGLFTRSPAPDNRTTRLLLLAFALLAAGIVTGGYFDFRSVEHELSAQAERNLSDITSFQVSSLTQYRKELLGDAELLSDNPVLSDLVRRCLAPSTDDAATRLLAAWLNKYRDHYQYGEAFLFDAAGVERMTTSRSREPAAALLAARVPALLRSERPVLQDFYQHERSRKIFLALLIPVRDPEDGGRPLGVLVLQIDPAAYIYPLLRGWPRPSSTAEVLLARREGNEMLILSDLRHRADAAMNLRLPLDNTDLPSVRAALGLSGTRVGVDYRGVPVLASATTVPDTSWVLVVKVDAVEAFGPIWHQFWLTLLSVVVLLFGVGASMQLVRGQQSLALLRRAVTAERGRASAISRLAYLTEHAKDIILLFAEDMRIIDANTRALEAYGMTLQELRQHTAQDLRADLAKPTTEMDFSAALSPTGIRFETVHQRRNGTAFPVEVSARPIELEGRRHVLSTIRDITERKQAAAVLRESETRYRSLFDRASEGIIILSIEGELLAVNEAFARMHGVPASEMQSLNLRDLDTPEILQLLPARMRRLQAGENLTFETQHFHHDGHVFPLEVSASLISSGGKPFIQAFHRDITERKAAEAALRESEFRWKFAIEGSGDGLWDWNVPANTVFFSPRWKQMLGFAEDEIGNSLDEWYSRVHPDDQARTMADVQAHLAGTESLYNNEHRVRCKDGSWKWVLDRGVVVNRDAAGNPLRVIGTHSDITARKLAEEQLRTLSRLIEQAPLSVVITNLQGLIEYVNPKFCAVTGYTPDEVRGQNPRILKSGETSSEAYDEMWAAITRGQVWSGELHNRRKNGEVFLENAVIAPVVDPAGRATHYVALKDDITAQRRFMAESKATLEKEREISAMKTRFISITSHEFRTPMATVIGSVGLLANHLDRLAPEKRQQILARITTSLERMTVMLDEILILNRVDADRVQVRIMPVDFPLFVHDTVEEQRIADHDAHHYGFQSAGDLAGFATDTNLQHHILSNLLTNAARYSAAGTLITVRLEAEGERVRLAVEDQGIGIPAEDRVRIFEPFERGSNVGVITGTGLGLSIVKRLSGLLGGTIQYEAVPSGGSRFTLVFPRPSAPASSSGAPEVTLD